MRFAKVAEPEFPGHVLLEQFQAQVFKNFIVQSFIYFVGWRGTSPSIHARNARECDCISVPGCEHMDLFRSRS